MFLGGALAEAVEGGGRNCFAVELAGKGREGMAVDLKVLQGSDGK